MTVVRLLARPMLASMFVAGGVDSVLHPEAKAGSAGEMAPQLAQKSPVPLPTDPVQFVRVTGAVQVVAGLMLATGKMPRVAALALVASLAPAFAVRPFWAEGDPAARNAGKQQFLRNTTVLGGLLIAAVDTGGKPSLVHRGKDAAHRATHKVGRP